MDTMRVDATTIRSATAVADARGTTRAFLEALRQPAVASETADTAVLVVSELVTNALRHGGGTYTLRLAATRSAAWHQNPSRARCGVRCRKAMGHSPHRPCSLPPAMGEVGQGPTSPSPPPTASPAPRSRCARAQPKVATLNCAPPLPASHRARWQMMSAQPSRMPDAPSEKSAVSQHKPCWNGLHSAEPAHAERDTISPPDLHVCPSTGKIVGSSQFGAFRCSPCPRRWSVPEIRRRPPGRRAESRSSPRAHHGTVGPSLDGAVPAQASDQRSCRSRRTERWAGPGGSEGLSDVVSSALTAPGRSLVSWCVRRGRSGRRGPRMRWPVGVGR